MAKHPDLSGQVLEIGSRLKSPPSRRLIETAFRRELDDQLPLFDALNRVDLAHTLAMIENGVVPPADGRKLLAALTELAGETGEFDADPACGDLYTNRESRLAAMTSATAWLGVGRARREAITTAYTIELRERLLRLADSLTEFGSTLVALSAAHRDDPMPDYTYLQQAQPTTFGHYLLGFAYPTLRDLERLQAVYVRLNLSPAGCGSNNGSRLRQSRSRLAELLGFDGVTAHARDAMWQADLQIEIAALLAAVLINLDRLAEDMQIFCSDEFALLELDDRHARASKIMPQKKNPFALTHIRLLANASIGMLTETAAAGRTPSGQPDNRLALYGTMPKAIREESDAAALMSEVVALLKFDRRNARQKLDGSFAMATDLAETLVSEAGVSFRDAHRIVGRLAREFRLRGGFRALTVTDIADCAETMLGRRIELSDSALAEALNPECCIAARREPGGAAVQPMSDMLRDCRRRLDEAADWHRRSEIRLQEADKLLQRSVDALLDSFLTG